MTTSDIANRQFLRFASRATIVFLCVGLATPAMAEVGKGLLDFAAANIIAPLGIFAIVIALAGSIFRPDLVRGAIYAAIICAVLFFVIKSSGTIVSALKS